jgi:hypothetical protein
MNTVTMHRRALLIQAKKYSQHSWQVCDKRQAEFRHLPAIA